MWGVGFGMRISNMSKTDFERAREWLNQHSNDDCEMISSESLARALAEGPSLR